jgi:hypothetical protein
MKSIKQKKIYVRFTIAFVLLKYSTGMAQFHLHAIGLHVRAA